MADTLSFREKLYGFHDESTMDPTEGYEHGDDRHQVIRAQFQIEIDDVDGFVESPRHEARLTGHLSATGIGDRMEVANGRFRLFVQERGHREMQYELDVLPLAGSALHLEGKKSIRKDRPIPFDAISDLTTLFSQLTRTSDGAAEPAGAGIMRFNVIDFPGLVRDIKTSGDGSSSKRGAIRKKFLDFAVGTAVDVYVHDLP